MSIWWVKWRSFDFKTLHRCTADLHSIDSKPYSQDDILYLYKNIERISKVDLLLPTKHKYLNINGKITKIRFMKISKISSLIQLKKSYPRQILILRQYMVIQHFEIFSTWQKKSGVLIDPRGKFGNALIYGDPYYDFSKLHTLLRGVMIYLIKNWIDNFLWNEYYLALPMSNYSRHSNTVMIYLIRSDYNWFMP